ncbi:MAG TPA: hypothetical protein G4N95_08655 [Anaerolineae bacterium]|nr:hypothetical protein [Anaerolineae bacterium]
MKKSKDKYPIGTIVYYGPDNKTITKIIVSVFDYPDILIISKTWSGDKIIEDPVVAKEIGAFLKIHGAKEVAMTDGPVGCPHVEGVDYPKGETCPYCPYWSNRTNPKKG